MDHSRASPQYGPPNAERVSEPCGPYIISIKNAMSLECSPLPRATLMPPIPPLACRSYSPRKPPTKSTSQQTSRLRKRSDGALRTSSLRTSARVLVHAHLDSFEWHFDAAHLQAHCFVSFPPCHNASDDRTSERHPVRPTPVLSLVIRLSIEPQRDGK